MSKIIVIGSQKGGVGKTMTTFNLAHVLAKMGKKVLAVDFDSQANLIIYCRKLMMPRNVQIFVIFLLQKFGLV